MFSPRDSFVSWSPGGRLTTEKQRQIAQLAETPLEPLEFCQRWVKCPAPGERGYQAACVRELARACGISKLTVKGWGQNFQKRPSQIPNMLRVVDMLRQILPHFERFEQIQK